VSNADEFISTFNQIETYLRSLSETNRHREFLSLLDEVSKSNTVVRKYREDLRQYAKLRNAIVHQITNEPIAEPSSKTVDNIQKIYECLTKPPMAEQIASKPVEYCCMGDLISEVIEKMTKHDFTCMPVYENNRFKGVFSESSVVRWLEESCGKDGFLLEQTTMQHLEKYFISPSDNFQGYKFIPRKTNVFEVQDFFLSFTENRRRLAALFITENGKKEEAILGIITAWDLPKINEKR